MKLPECFKYIFISLLFISLTGFSQNTPFNCFVWGIDKMVYILYELTEDDIKIIES